MTRTIFSHSNSSEQFWKQNTISIFPCTALDLYTSFLTIHTFSFYAYLLQKEFWKYTSLQEMPEKSSQDEITLVSFLMLIVSETRLDPTTIQLQGWLLLQWVQGEQFKLRYKSDKKSSNEKTLLHNYVKQPKFSDINCLYFFEPTSFQRLGQNYIGFLVQTMTSKSSFEIN